MRNSLSVPVPLTGTPSRVWALTWADMFARAKTFYSHYESILDGDVVSPGFRSKEIEVARTRSILETRSSHRSKEDRKRGLGDTET